MARTPPGANRDPGGTPPVRPAGPAARLFRRFHEAWLEALFGIRTAERTRGVERAPDGSLWKNHAPIDYRSFAAAIRRVPLRPGVDVFVDYGAGLGRAVVLAARLPYRRVIGVEVRPELAERGRENLRRAARRLRCPDARIVTASADEFGVPDDATVLHLFDPFAGPVLERLCAALGASLERAPRTVSILYADDHHFAEIAPALPWIRLRERIPWAVATGEHPERCTYGIYEAVAGDRPR